MDISIILEAAHQGQFPWLSEWQADCKTSHNEMCSVNYFAKAKRLHGRLCFEAAARQTLHLVCEKVCM